MDYQLKTTTLYPDRSGGTVYTSLPVGSYIVGVTAQGNQVVVTYWEPQTTRNSPEYIDVQLLLVTDHYVLSDYSLDALSKITPNRLRYLGHATVDNGDTTYHAFEIQSAIYSEHDGTVI